MQLRVLNPQDIDNARRTVEQVLKVKAAVSPEAGKITASLADADLVTDLLVALRTAGIHLTELSVQKPTLDEVFLTITGHGVKENDSLEFTESNRVEEARV
ncbi:hypothetical protein J2Z66_008643 [Paenibacillus eucommiae]|uniref:DUF4162 domain-containing protein n=1 Tax=Paenibacillus eucommiae TaxID=1355755 RepID=A0ABS4JAU2_9BACL|nr:hypothetical protein [Paenibacillus eucommiae]